MTNRKSVLFYINEKRHEVTGEATFSTLSDYLRYEMGLTGTKVVCAEGDCGACTVLLASVHELDKGKWIFKAVNSCILPVFSLDGCQVVTVEGLREKTPHPVQRAMVENFGSQCGFCTPGFVCAMTAMAEDSILRNKTITEKRSKNYLTGNLCRCTGYQPILKAAMSLDLNQIETLQSRFHDPKKIRELQIAVKRPATIIHEHKSIFLPTTVRQALLLKKKNKNCGVVAGATDLGVAVNKGRLSYIEMMSLQNIASLWKIEKRKSAIEIHCRASLAQLQKYLSAHNPELEQVLNIFASPQIKNMGTLVGNLVNASPISDTIPFLLVSDAVVVVESVSGKRKIPIEKFIIGYKKLNLKSTEIVRSVLLPVQSGKSFAKLYKVSLRKDLDISAVTMAVRLKLKGNRIEEAKLAFGGVGPMVTRLTEIEGSWKGQQLNPILFRQAALKVVSFISPISDVRGSKEFRQKLCQNLLLKLADELEQESTT